MGAATHHLQLCVRNRLHGLRNTKVRFLVPCTRHQHPAAVQTTTSPGGLIKWFEIKLNGLHACCGLREHISVGHVDKSLKPLTPTGGLLLVSSAAEVRGERFRNDYWEFVWPVGSLSSSGELMLAATWLQLVTSFKLSSCFSRLDLLHRGRKLHRNTLIIICMF